MKELIGINPLDYANNTRKKEEILESKKQIFLDNLDIKSLDITEEELESIKELDTIGKSPFEIKSLLRGRLNNNEKVDNIWSTYLDHLRHKETIIVNEHIQDILKHKEKTSPIVDFLDWNYIINKLRNGVYLKKAKHNEIILDKNNAGKNLYFILDGEIKYQKIDIENKIIKEAINKPYEIFGEQALLNNKISDSSNIVESREATLLCLDEKTFTESLERQKHKSANKLECLQIELPEKVKMELLENGRLNLYRTNQSITTQNKSQDMFRILLKGTVFVLRDSHIVNTIKEGGFIGEIELFHKDKKNIASVITNEDCVVLEIPSFKIEEILNEHKSLKMQLSQSAYKKDLEGRVKETNSDPYNLYNYEFTLLENNEKNTLIKEKITHQAKELLSLIIASSENPNEEVLEELYSFICSKLELQQYDDPQYYPSHGAMHSINVLNFSNALIEGSPNLKKSIENIFGIKNGNILLKLACLFHDIGYPELSKRKEKFKWKHQIFSAHLVQDNLPFEKLNKILNINKNQYDLFIEAIKDHASDNRDKIKEGRNFIETTNNINPILLILRISDNLDLISERLTKLQKQDIFMNTLELFYNDCHQLVQSEKNSNEQKLIQKTKNKMTEIFNKINFEKIIRNANQDDKILYQEISNNLKKIVERNDWKAYHHFKSIMIGQNVYVKEETKDNKSCLSINIEYNEPSNKLPLSLINYQSGRLVDSIEQSMKIFTDDNKELPIKLKQVFPVPNA